MRPLAPVVLLSALVLAPLALAHGGGLHLAEVELSYAPLALGQRLRFEVHNDGAGDAPAGLAHVYLPGNALRERHPVPPIPSGATIDHALVLELRAAPYACMYVTAGLKSSDEVCVLSSSVSLV